MDQAEQEIRDVQQRWMEAASRKDEPVLDAILGDEYVLISARLGFVDREGLARDGTGLQYRGVRICRVRHPRVGCRGRLELAISAEGGLQGARPQRTLLPDRRLGQARRALASRDPSFNHRPISLSWRPIGSSGGSPVLRSARVWWNPSCIQRPPAKQEAATWPRRLRSFLLPDCPDDRCQLTH
jgi:hypothetical protein